MEKDKSILKGYGAHFSGHVHIFLCNCYWWDCRPPVIYFWPDGIIILYCCHHKTFKPRKDNRWLNNSIQKKGKVSRTF